MVKDDEQKILSLQKKGYKSDTIETIYFGNSLTKKMKKKTKYNETNTLIYFSPSLRVSLVGIAGILRNRES